MACDWAELADSAEFTPDMGTYELAELAAIVSEEENLHFKEAVTCIAQGEDLLDFDAWCHVNELLGCTISWDQYSWLDLHTDGILIDYEANDVPRMNEVLKTYTKEIQNYQVLRKQFGSMWEESGILEYFKEEICLAGLALVFSSESKRNTILTMLHNDVSRSSWQFHAEKYMGDPAIVIRWSPELYD